MSEFNRIKNFLRKFEDFKIYINKIYYIFKWLELFVCSFLDNKISVIFVAIMPKLFKKVK